MKLFGFELTRSRKSANYNLTPYGGGWFPIIREPFRGAWQRNQEIVDPSVNILSFHAVYACVSLIAADIAKLSINLEGKDGNGIWSSIANPAFSPVLRKPNDYQNAVQFIQQWVMSKLLNGNAYVLKERDNRGIVTRLYVLDPFRIRPAVGPDGSVYYNIGADPLSGVTQDLEGIPADEVIHDVMSPLFHPLCGVSPITACALAASQGLNIQRNSDRFFRNGAQPSGIITAPAQISQDVATRIKTHWEQNYSGDNVGRVAVLGDGLAYQSISVNAVDAQLIEQLKWSAETVCSVFHVPTYMVTAAELPRGITNVESLAQLYLDQCLQIHIKSIEVALDVGLGLVADGPQAMRVRFDLDDLLRMDTATKVEAVTNAIKGGLMKPNEGRAKFDLPPVTGGDEVYLQQQNYSLAALAKRDAKADPFATGSGAAPASAPAPADNPPPADEAQTAREAEIELRMYAYG
jgi:HK97 family phage portal protein